MALFLFAISIGVNPHQCRARHDRLAMNPHTTRENPPREHSNWARFPAPCATDRGFVLNG